MIDLYFSQRSSTVIKIVRVKASDDATREFICTYRAIVELWMEGEVDHATPVRNLEELLDVVERYEACLSD